MVTKGAQNRLFPSLGLGLGLRPPHYREVLGGRASVSWFEVISENFMGDGGRPLAVLEKVRRDFPVALHGVSLSLGSADPSKNGYAKEHLQRLRALVKRFDPAIVSDHCCWTEARGRNLHDLLPLPFTDEAIGTVVSRVSQVQEALGRRILIENVSSYLSFPHSEMTEWEFLAEIARRADCGILLDINNIYVSSVNHGFDPLEYLAGIPGERVGQVHLAGHSILEGAKGKRFLIDTHDEEVCQEVWDLYAHAFRRFGDVSTMVEWDAKIPSYSRLEGEVRKAGAIQKRIREEGIEGRKLKRAVACAPSAMAQPSHR